MVDQCIERGKAVPRKSNACNTMCALTERTKSQFPCMYVTGFAKRSYSLSNCMQLTVHCETCEYFTNPKFGHLTLLTRFYS